MTSDPTVVKAIIFDWGGTLTPWHDIDLVAQWAEYARVYDPRDTGLAQRLADAELAQWAEQQATRGANGTGALEHIWITAGVDTASRRHRDAQQAYLDGWDPHTVADPDAVGTLARLRESGLLIGVLSNTMWPRWHHEKVFARDGLLELIDVAVYSSELPVAKPHSDAFRAVLDMLGVSASESVFVGDRPWDDIHGAQQVGMRAIHIPHSRLGNQAVEIAVQPDAVAHRLKDVPGIVEAWC